MPLNYTEDSPQGLVKENAEYIAEQVLETYKQHGKRILLMGYSKGGVDALAALALYPSIVPYIRAVITLFSPIYGSHIATSLTKPGLTTAIRAILQLITTIDLVRILLPTSP